MLVSVIVTPDLQIVEIVFALVLDDQSRLRPGSAPYLSFGTESWEGVRDG
jgi:hypothetical protein